MKFIGFETSTTCFEVMVLSYDKPLDKLLACRESLLHQMEEFRLEDKQYDFQLHFDMSTYKKMHATVSSDLTDQANIFDRNLIGISLREADKVHM